jgi:hypothetical protein
MSGASRRTIQGSIRLIRIDGQNRRPVKYRFSDFIHAYSDSDNERATELAKRLLDSQGLRPASGKASADIGRHLRSEEKHAEKDIAIMSGAAPEAEPDDLWREERIGKRSGGWKAQRHAHWAEENQLLNERTQARKASRPRQTKRGWNY